VSRRQWISLLAFSCANSALAVEPERDDPAARERALQELRGEPNPAGQWRVLQEARKQRDRWAIGAPAGQQGFRGAQRVQGGTFVNIGPASADFEYNYGKYFEIDSGRVRQILAHPTDPGILYLSTAGGGVWKSWDAGGHWEPLTDAMGTTAMGTLAMDPMNADILYLGFGDPFDVHQPGLVKSSDGGATWSDPVRLVATDGRVATTVADLKVDPASSAIVFAATDVGLFRSIDGGANWTQLPLVGAASTDTAFLMWSVAYAGASTWLATGQIADPAKPLSAAGNAGAMGLWRSTDGGKTWAWNGSALPGGDATAAAAGRGTLATAASTLVDPATARIFLLAASVRGNAQLDLFRSDDGGKSFAGLGTNATGRPPNPNPNQTDLDLLHAQAWYNQALTVDPQEPDLVFVGGDLSLARSSDGGNGFELLSNWMPVPQDISAPYVHADLHSVAIGADGVVYVGSDGGIGVSAGARTDLARAVTFSSTQNRGLVTHLIYSVACAPETWPAELQGWVGGGLQDNGTRLRSGATTVFNQVQGGDGIGLSVSRGTHLDAASQAAVPDVLIVSSEYKLFRSTDGGGSWTSFTTGFGAAQLPFFVRLARDIADPDSQAFVTFTGDPAGVYLSASGGSWRNISGSLHWQDSDRDTLGFVTVDNLPIGLRNVATHPLRAGLYAVASNKFAYVSADAGAHWLVSLQPAPVGTPPGTGLYLLSSIAFDPADPSGNSYYLTSRAMNMIDGAGKLSPLPESFGHLYKTIDGGRTWTSPGAGAGGLPFVPALAIAVDPGDTNTLYLGTALGLYRSLDRGGTWSRFGAGSLPLVEVTDLCISPASKRLTVATYGRGFWQIGTDITTNPAGVRGNGDTNFDQRIDGLDLIDLADAFGTTQASDGYRWQADLVGTVNAIDGDDLAALLAKFGGRP
jgi:hypothetical protein